MPLPIPPRRPTPGFYWHYKHDPAKGSRDYAYEILNIGFHTEDDCQERDQVMMVYRPLYPSSVYEAGQAFDLRPLGMFYEPAQVAGKSVERFVKIEDPAVIAELKAARDQMYPPSY